MTLSFGDMPRDRLRAKAATDSPDSTDLMKAVPKGGTLCSLHDAAKDDGIIWRTSIHASIGI
jgi:hypothetical protein